MKQNLSLAIIVVILIGVSGIGILLAGYLDGKDTRMVSTIPADKVPSHIQGPIGTININAPLPRNPELTPIYRGYYIPGGCVTYSSPNQTLTKNNIPSISDAPLLAQMALAPYGGIPSGAIVTQSGQSIIYERDKITGNVVKEYPISTVIVYEQNTINGMPLEGKGQLIQLDFGEGGELLWLLKRWRTYDQIDQVPVISAPAALEKLVRGEVLDHYQSEDPSEDISVTNISLGYYSPYDKRREVILEPVWIFSGKKANGNKITYCVDARISGSSLQFANFTASPTKGTAPLTVQFRDTSTGPVWHWRWDFGDGTIDWTQNPVHTYQNEGIFTVTLLVMDDERDNSLIKTNYILIGKKAIVMHIGTKLDELLVALTAMDIQQGRKNSLIQKLENAKAKNSDALKFIDQNKEDQANSMLNAEDNMIQAFMNEVDAQNGKGIKTEGSARPNSGAAEIRDLIQKAIETPI